MKRISLISILIALFLGMSFFISSQIAIANGPVAAPYSETWTNSALSDSSLKGIQDRIYQSFVKSIMSSEPKSMNNLMLELETYHQEKKQKLALYWMSYAQYYQSISYLKGGKKEEAKIACSEAVKRLENMKAKNSEDFALLAMIKSFSIQFQAPMKAPITSNKVKKYAEKAISLDDKNLRAYYVLASNDFYTPEQYGGLKKSESYLKKAIALNDQAIPNPYLPSWGKEESYEMLIKYYIKKAQWAEAKAIFKEANEKYPSNYQINQLATKLVGK
ncbi:MAG: hypothetical protein MRZ79_07295 [Bacteroidia bacterium]|nr:hypothetical protein [Bacteroidia bacterium]